MSKNEIFLPDSKSDLPVVSTKAVVTKEDIVAIGVASVEQKLIDAERDILRQIEENDSNLHKATNLLSRCAHSLANEKTKSMIEDMNKAAKAFGIENFVGLRDANLSKDNNGKDIVLVSFHSKSRDVQFATQSYPADKKTIEAYAKLKGLQKNGEKLSHELRNIRVKMTQMPRLERNLKAVIAKKQLLESGEKGSDLVNLVETNTAEFLSKL